MQNMTSIKLALFSLLTGCCTQLFGQTYINETARWEQYTSYYQSFQSNNYCSITYFISGDTISNGTFYYRLMRAADCTYINPNLDSLGNMFIDTSTYNDTVFSRYIRDANQTLYTYDAETNTETWVYRFNIIEPISIDSVISEVNGCGTYPEILAHDTVCIGNIPRKRWSLTQGVGAVQSFIEGVGPGSGLFGNICNTFCPECSAGLTRFMLNGDTLYSGSCTSTAGLPAMDSGLSNIAVDIQPGSFTIHSVSDVEVSLFSLDGRNVFKSNYQGNGTIYLNEFRPGIYLYRIQSKDAMQAGKFMHAN